MKLNIYFTKKTDFTLTLKNVLIYIAKLHYSLHALQQREEKRSHAHEAA